MRNKKFQLNIYQPNDIAAMEAHLEKMARRGWQLEGMNNWGWRFRRAEPAETRYTVTCFPDASVYDSAPTLGQETYADFCRAAGWEFVSAYGPMQIFRALRPDAAPIETDEGEKLRAVHRSICRTWLPGYGLLLAVWLLNILIRLPEIFRRPLEFLSSNQQMASFALMVGLVAYLAVFMLDYLVWYLRSRRAVAEGGACKAPHTRGRLWAGGVLLVLCAVSLLATFADATSTGRVLSLVYAFGGMALIMALAQWLLSWAKRRGLSRRAVRWTSIVGAVVLALVYTAGILPLTFGLIRSGLMEEDRVAYVYTGKYGEQNVYRDPIPLTLEDLGYTVTQADHCTYIMEGERSPLLGFWTCVQRPMLGTDSQLPELEYTVLEVPWAWLRDRLVAGWAADCALEEVQDHRWGADRVFRTVAEAGTESERLLLVYGHRAYLFPTGQQSGIAEEQLLTVTDKIKIM